MNFAPNLDVFGALQRVRDCLLKLSAADYVAHRVRISDGSAVVEINEPLVGIEPVTELKNHLQVDFCGCAVVWRKPQPTEANGNGN